jgi:hypothetical protein
MSNPAIKTTTAQGQALSQADFALGQSCLSPAADSAKSSNTAAGPRTEAGKAIASRNAVKHNLCSKSLTGADREEFLTIRARLDEEWEPATETENLLLDQMALSQWRMDRALSLELNAFNLGHLDEKLLALALRYRTTAERSFYKAPSELQRLRKTTREDALRHQKIDEQDREAAAIAALDRLCFAPIAPAPQFVSQNPPAPRPQPSPDIFKAHRKPQISAVEGRL